MKIIKKIWQGIQVAFQKATDATDVAIPIAVHIIEGIKVAVDSGTADFIVSLAKMPIKGTADDALIDKAYSWLKSRLPVLATSLSSINSIAKIKDPNERLVAILRYYQTAASDEKTAFYGGLAADAAVYLKDGKLSLSESLSLTTKFYNNVIKPNKK